MTNAYIKYISALLVLGFNGIVASFISLNSYEIVLMRTLIGAVCLVLIFVLSRQKLQFWQKKKQFGFLIISSVSMGGGWMFLFEAYKLVGVSVATLAYYCGPVIVMALAPVLFKEKVTVVKITGFIVVITGMLCVNGASLMTEGLSWGLICGILSAFMYSSMVIFNKKAKDFAGLENSMWQLVICFVVSGIFTLIAHSGDITFHIPRGDIIPILILGIINTGAGVYLYFSSIQKLTAQSVSILGYLEPLSALVFSAILLKEQLTLIQLVGAAFILGGAAFGELYRQKRHRIPAESE